MRPFSPWKFLALKDVSASRVDLRAATFGAETLLAVRRPDQMWAAFKVEPGGTVAPLPGPLSNR